MAGIGLFVEIAQDGPERAAENVAGLAGGGKRTVRKAPP